MKQFPRIALIGMTLLLIAWLLVTAIQSRHDSRAAMGVRTADPIVGIWRSQHGVILDLRADGTARRRSVGDKANIDYYHYQRHGKQLVVYYSAKPDEYLRRLRHAVFGMSADNWDISELSNSELQLIDPDSGETYVFSRAEDSVLAAAP